MATPTPRTVLTGDHRAAIARRAAELYVQGCTIQSTARQIGRSYGTTRTLLLEAGVTLRPRGGTRTRFRTPARARE